jgi:cytochrome c oxidase subunit 2
VPTNVVPSIFHPSSPEASAIYDLTFWVTVLCAVILLLVVGLIIHACIRFREKAGAPEPKQVHGSPLLETIWTAIPLLIVTALIFFMIKTMVTVSPSGPSGKPDLIVIGHQWWWEVRYPLANGTEAITANEIHIPVGKRLQLELRSADVIHDFWVPDLGRKIDAIPGQPNSIWLEADRAGTFLGFCAEFCGTSHAWMQIRVMAESEPDYQAWLNRQASPAAAPVMASAKRGFEIFRGNTCMNCHSINNANGNGAESSNAIQIGPDLTHLAGRETLVAGALKNTPDQLTQWLKNPDRIKPGAHMPVFGFKKDELYDLSSYLESLK